MKLNNFPIIRPNIISRYYGNRSLLINENKKEGYVLENIYNLIWREIDDKKTIKDLIDILFKKNKLKKEEILKIIKEFKKLNLIHLKENPSFTEKRPKLLKVDSIRKLNYEQNKKFLSLLYNFTNSSKVPPQVTFELTYKCNFKCVHCYNQKGRINRDKELSFDEIKNILDDLVKLGTPFIQFTGGEIFVRRDITKILEYASKNFLLGIKTNGSLINENNIDKLKDLNFHQIEISLYGASENTYNIITKNKKSFKQVMNSLKLLSKTKLPIGISVINLKENEKETKKMINFVKKLGFSCGFLGEIIPTDKGGLEPLKHICSYQKHLELMYPKKKILKEIVKQMLTKKIKINPKQKMCIGLGSQIVIDPFGYVKPCIEWRVYKDNVREKSIKEIYRNSKTLNMARNITYGDFPNCMKCEFINICFSCPVHALECKEWKKKINKNKIKDLKKMYKKLFKKNQCIPLD